MSTETEALRGTVLRRAASAASYINGVSYDDYRLDRQKRSACEMALIVSGRALGALLACGAVRGAAVVQRLIVLGAALEMDASDRVPAETSWRAVRLDLPCVAALVAGSGFRGV